MLSNDRFRAARAASRSFGITVRMATAPFSRAIVARRARRPRFSARRSECEAGNGASRISTTLFLRSRSAKSSHPRAGANAPALGWDDFADLDLKNKVVLILDAPLPASHSLRRAENLGLLARRATIAREKGAVAILTVIPKEREAALAARNLSFDNIARGRPMDTEISLGSGFQPAVFQVDLRHDAAAGLLGISRGELDQLFDRVAAGQRPPSHEVAGRQVDVTVGFESRKGATRNVVAMVEGSDPVLRNEYVLIGSHHDGIGYREDQVFPGADDNISGVVAMFSLGRAPVSYTHLRAHETRHDLVCR